MRYDVFISYAHRDNARSDYIGRSADFRGLAEAITDDLFLVPRLNPEELREAIEGPVRVASVEITNRKVSSSHDGFINDACATGDLTHLGLVLSVTVEIFQWLE